MVYCKGHTIFLKSVDTSDKIKDHKWIYRLLKCVVNEVGEKNIVQTVTDNGSAFVKAANRWVLYEDCALSLCAIAVRILMARSKMQPALPKTNIPLMQIVEEEKMMEVMEMIEEVGILVQEVGMVVQQVGCSWWRLGCWYNMLE
ncbi:hypothetical protein Ddye_008724 [Dipteronia dyeriana]|uniref:DUF659 domain-containing protein n=1 Tax=Dipteronia dyeriana TaxID=168575 RepID=A0AAD9XAC0_9ROSI|nr:hypothetical protein Ddye_008724 [Dipteronia dyeriana]